MRWRNQSKQKFGNTYLADGWVMLTSSCRSVASDSNWPSPGTPDFQVSDRCAAFRFESKLAPLVSDA